MKKKPARLRSKTVSKVEFRKPVPLKSPLSLGNKVLIRSVTNFYTGKIVLINREEVVLTDAAWIADTGRFSECLKTGQFAEVEPYPDGMLVSVGRGAVCDTSVWPFELPRAVK